MLQFIILSQVLGFMADRHFYKVKQGDGELITIGLRGDDEFFYEVDRYNIAIVKDSNLSNRYYADPVDFVASKTKVSDKYMLWELQLLGYIPHKHPKRPESLRKRRSTDVQPPKSTLNNLVVPIKWSNHRDRVVPSKENIDSLFNTDVKMYWNLSSYGNLDINSTTMDWLQLNISEIEAANKTSGRRTPQLLFAMATALLHWNNYRDYDSVTFVHSGNPAEWGEADCFGVEREDRIWSHKSGITSDLHYMIVSAFDRGSCTDITKVNTILHELGHILGLEDYYDVDGIGNGIGAWGIMGYSYGISNDFSHVPLLMPYNKALLGYLDYTEITDENIGQRFEILPSQYADQVYKITAGFNSPEEYLLVEFRTNLGLESSIGVPGLIIWHIDESGVLDLEDGKHYKVAVVQADNRFDLENDRPADVGDLFRTNSTLFPNYDASYRVISTNGHYSGSNYVTRLIIDEIEISKTAEKAYFRVRFDYNATQKRYRAHYQPSSDTYVPLWQPVLLMFIVTGTAFLRDPLP